ncbi:MAG: type II secretion system protein GspL [Parahaliea sp.]
MHNYVVLRRLGEKLIWYPPGSGGSTHLLDSEEAVQHLRSTLAQQRWNLCFAVPAESLRLLSLSVGEDEKKHLSQSLPFMLEEQIAGDIDQLHFASVACNDSRYGVAICSKVDMALWQQHLDILGNIDQCLPEVLLLPWREREWCLLVEQERVLVRSNDCEGFACDPEMAPLLLSAALSAGEPQVVVIYGQDQTQDSQLLPPQLRERCQWRRGDFSTALVLTDSIPALNLRQGAFAPRLPLQRWWQQWRLIAAVLAVALSLQLLANWLDYRMLQAQDLSLRAAREASYRQAYPQGKVIDPEKQLKRQLASMQGSGSSSGFIAVMDNVGQVLANEPGALLASINYSDRGGDLRMNIVAPDFESVERLRAGINASGLVATMESSSAQKEGVRARIRVEVGS